MSHYLNAFKNYAKTKGRASRKEFWMFTLFHYIFIFVFSFVDAYCGFYPGNDYSFDYGYLTIAYLLISACPAICLQVRRLHDVGKSGNWWLINKVPILDLYLLYLNLKASTPGTNKYGEPPTSNCTYTETKKNSDFTQTVQEFPIQQEIAAPIIAKYPVCIFDMNTHTLRKEVRDIDINKMPPSKFADNDTYYAVETIRDGKKVRTYHTKDSWNKQMEASVSEVNS